MCLLIVSIGCVVNIYFVKINFLQGKIFTYSFDPLQADFEPIVRLLPDGFRREGEDKLRPVFV